MLHKKKQSQNHRFPRHHKIVAIKIPQGQHEQNPKRNKTNTDRSAPPQHKTHTEPSQPEPTKINHNQPTKIKNTSTQNHNIKKQSNAYICITIKSNESRPQLTKPEQTEQNHYKNQNTKSNA